MLLKGEEPETMKTFTLDEAQSLLPVLESLLKRALESKRNAEELEGSLSSLSHLIHMNGGMRVDVGEVIHLRSEMNRLLKRVEESVEEIRSIGVEVKDLETGLLDFPCRLEEDVVLLCWKMGEKSIEHWHTVEAGSRGRKPVDDRFRRRPQMGHRPN